jgi:CO/xanthine dehydrogenase Mo-binding subunit
MILDRIGSPDANPGRVSASANSSASRRGFLQAGAAAGGGLLLSLSLPFANRDAEAAADGFTPNAFFRIERDGRIVLTMPYVEMGQGTYTSIPMLIAEELEVDLKQVQVEHAPPNEKLYGNPLLGGIQVTGNSNAVRASWQPLRQAGATARTMLVAAAAKRWNVDLASCHAQSGEVLHTVTGRRVKYGALAAEAARLPVPDKVALKRPQDFKLIGTPAKRLDTPGKVNGTSVYGIDVRPPGVKIARGCTEHRQCRKGQVGAVTKVEATYEVPFLAHATMEPMNCTVHVRKDGCEVWVGSQVIARVQTAAANTAGMPLDKVVVHNHLIGGGFGRRLEVDGVIRAVEIAKHVEDPVKVVWTREEDIQHDMYRPYWFDRFSAGLDVKGKPVAWNHRYAGSSVIARWAPPFFNNGLDPDTTEGAIDLVYALPNMHVEYVRVEPPGIPTAFWRSVGPSHTVFVVESFIDELAAAAKQEDPVFL